MSEIARVLMPGGRLVIGELGRRSLWAAQRRMRGWLGHPVWRAVKFRTAADLRRLAEAAGLRVVTIHGAVHYPPSGVAARLLAPIDLWLGRETTLELPSWPCLLPSNQMFPEASCHASRGRRLPWPGILCGHLFRRSELRMLPFHRPY
jgi:hypothetical protein